MPLGALLDRASTFAHRRPTGPARPEPSGRSRENPGSSGHRRACDIHAKSSVWSRNQLVCERDEMIDWAEWFPPDPESEADFATLRSLGRTTVGKSFALRFGSSSDVGSPARTVWQVISEGSSADPLRVGDEDEVTLHESRAGRVQVKARIVRERGRVTELRFERVTGQADHDARIENLLNLDEV